MSLRGASRLEWVSAASLVLSSVGGLLLLRVHASSVEEASERRRAQLDQLAELSATVPACGAPAKQLAGLDGLFPGYRLIAEALPCGTFVTLRAHESCEGMR